MSTSPAAISKTVSLRWCHHHVCAEPLAPYLYAVAVIAACTAVGWLMFQRFAATDIVMVYLVGIVAVSLRFGRGPSVLASILGVGAFDFFLSHLRSRLQ